jgi:RNA polymerase sigma factor (sigma-70 family)
VTHRTIPALVRQLAETGPPVTDAELLGRLAADRDGDALSALMRRHGRLVWAVCRNLAGPDADDAFQATFLVLFRNARKVRNPGGLAAWLHGVAYRICSKARRAAERRAGRERAAAVPDRDTAAVPDSAWDRALAVVHEEVGRLPETLRVPFVLCVLEGRGVTEAAGHLGWKVNTLSARLGRAKDTLLARLRARGFAAGAAVALAVPGAAAPAATAARAAALVRGGGPVPGSVHHLTQGVLGMTATQVKLLAAGVLLTVGLGVGGGAGWLAPAGAQPPAPPAPTPEERVKRLEAQLDQARREVELQRERERLKSADLALAAAYSTAKWQYHFVSVTDLGAEGFVKVLQDREAVGWEYNGQATLTKDGRAAAVWIFRRPAGGGVGGHMNKLGPPNYPELPGLGGAAKGVRP